MRIKESSKSFYFASLLFFLLFGCTSDHNSKKEEGLVIAVAANVQFAIKEIKHAFEEEFKKNVDIIIGSSGKLTAQIKQGAPYDLFLSANMKYPESLYQDGFALNSPQEYALGSLVLWTMYTTIPMEGDVQILNHQSIKKIGIANPKNAPYGEQAINVLAFYNLSKRLESKLVYGESIAQTNQYILAKSCEIGITAKSVVVSPSIQGKGIWKEIDDSAYTKITQGVVITKHGAKHHLEMAQAFYDFLFTPKAEEIFRKYGYTIPSSSNE